MSKFGELIDAQVPVLIDFFTEWHEQSITMNETIRHVAAALGDKAKVIKIDVDKNKELAEALRIKGLPTFMIFEASKSAVQAFGLRLKFSFLRRVSASSMLHLVRLK